MIEALQIKKVLQDFSSEQIEAIKAEKLSKVSKYMAYSQKQGLLEK